MTNATNLSTAVETLDVDTLGMAESLVTIALSLGLGAAMEQADPVGMEVAGLLAAAPAGPVHNLAILLWLRALSLVPNGGGLLVERMADELREAFPILEPAALRKAA